MKSEYPGLILDRERALTAELVQQRIRMEEGLLALQEIGVPVDISYKGDAVWLTVGDDEVSRIVVPDWWDAGLATREDRAIEVTGWLFRAWRTLTRSKS